MKKIIIASIAFLLAATLHAQNINIGVKRTPSAPDTSFRYIPGNLLMYVDHFTVNYDTAFVKFEVHFTENPDSTLYLQKETFTRFTAKVPFTQWSNAFNTDGSINSTIINQIINPFKLTY